jgi:hypothetical protein
MAASRILGLRSAHAAGSGCEQRLHDRWGGDGGGQGVVGVVLWDFPEPSTPTRSDSIGGTSTTSSPAALAAGPTGSPPPADSMAHRRSAKTSAHSSTCSHCVLVACTL